MAPYCSACRGMSSSMSTAPLVPKGLELLPEGIPVDQGHLQATLIDNQRLSASCKGCFTRPSSPCLRASASGAGPHWPALLLLLEPREEDFQGGSRHIHPAVVRHTF